MVIVIINAIANVIVNTKVYDIEGVYCLPHRLSFPDNLTFSFSSVVERASLQAAGR